MNYIDFDLEGRVKVPVGFYLVLVYLLRGYFIWVISLTHRENPGLIISLIYPLPSVFYTSMLIGIPGLMAYALFLSKGRLWTRLENKVWPIFWYLIPIGLFADLALQGMSMSQSHFLVHWSGPVIFLFGAYLTWYWLSSKRLKRFFSLWLIDVENKESSETDVNSKTNSKET